MTEYKKMTTTTQSVKQVIVARKHMGRPDLALTACSPRDYDADQGKP